jgi:peptidoglycan/LPS O-acetylase OafA/YrhL
MTSPIRLEQVSPEASGATYRPEVDGLRALALIAVIINHFNASLLPSGYLGVDIFFVISGYVITKSLLKRKQQSFRQGIVGFYARRIKRLVPALVFCVVVTAIIACFFDPAPGVSLQTGLFALLGLSNLYLFSQSTDYFAPSSEMNMFTQTWSLGVEEQFYLIFPALLLVAGFWAGDQVNINQTKPQAQKKLFFIIFALSVISLIAFSAAYAVNASAAYFLMPARFWELGSGCLLAIAEQKINGSKKLGLRLRSGLPLASVIGFFLVFHASQDHAVFATISVIALTTILIATVRSNQLVMSLLANPLAVWIGLISYSLYLWHWSIISLSRWTIGIQWWTWPFQLLIMIVLATISYYGIEKPLRHVQWSRFEWLTLVKGLLATLAGIVALITLGRPLEGKLFLGNGGRAAEQKRMVSGVVEAKSNDKDLLLAKSMADKHMLDCNITPFLLGQNSRQLTGPVDEPFIQKCIRGPEEARTTKPNLIVVGDSFAEKLLPHAALISVKTDHGFGAIFGYGCPYPLRSSLIFNPSFPSCRYIDEDLLEAALLKSLRPGDVVLLRIHLPNRSYVRYPTGHTQPRPDAYDKALQSFLARVSERGARVVVVGPNPTLSTQELMALRPEWFNAWNRKEDLDLNNGQLSIYFTKLDSHLQHIAGSWSPHKYISLRPYICNSENKCILTKANKFLYSDDHHLSPYGHDLFFDALLAAIKPGREQPSKSDVKSVLTPRIQ